MPLIKTIQTDDKQQGDSSSSSAGFYSDNEHIGNFLSFKQNGNVLRKQSHLPLVSGDGSGSSGGGSSNGSGGGNENKSVVFDASSTLFFSNGFISCTLSKEQTHAYNLITKSVRETFIPVTINRNGKKVNALISVVSNIHKIKLSIDGATPTLNINLTLVCEKEETYENENVNELAKANKVSKDALKELERYLTQVIKELVSISVNSKNFFHSFK